MSNGLREMGFNLPASVKVTSTRAIDVRFCPVAINSSKVLSFAIAYSNVWNSKLLPTQNNTKWNHVLKQIYQYIKKYHVVTQVGCSLSSTSLLLMLTFRLDSKMTVYTVEPMRLWGYAIGLFSRTTTRTTSLVRTISKSNARRVGSVSNNFPHPNCWQKEFTNKCVTLCNCPTYFTKVVDFRVVLRSACNNNGIPASSILKNFKSVNSFRTSPQILETF